MAGLNIFLISVSYESMSFLEVALNQSFVILIKSAGRIGFVFIWFENICSGLTYEFNWMKTTSFCYRWSLSFRCWGKNTQISYNVSVWLVCTHPVYINRPVATLFKLLAFCLRLLIASCFIDRNSIESQPLQTICMACRVPVTVDLVLSGNSYSTKMSAYMFGNTPQWCRRTFA